jgi:hypothetical protein
LVRGCGLCAGGEADRVSGCADIRRGTTYPSAPLCPAARRRHFWARNHLIATPGAEPLSDEQLDELELRYHEQREGLRVVAS